MTVLYTALIGAETGEKSRRFSLLLLPGKSLGALVSGRGGEAGIKICSGGSRRLRFAGDSVMT
jgi:hypothetical protein